MPITIEDLHATITSLYSSEVRIADERLVVFGLACGDYVAHIDLHLWSQFDSKAAPQAIGISFVFMKPDGYEYTVNHLDTTVVGQFCISQQAIIDWSSLEIHDEEDDDKVVVLYRAIGTSADDLRLAKERDFASQLHTALFHMVVEFETIAPAVVKLATTVTGDEKQIQTLLDMSTDGTAM